MSREIKFRAWDFDNKSLIYPDSELGTIFCFDKVGLSIYHCDGYELSSFNVMQYTEIKDKNGKEIYEGDIIRYSHKAVGEIRRVVSYKYGMYGINGIMEGTHIPFANIVESEYEVVGNIYENQELLEGI